MRYVNRLFCLLKKNRFVVYIYECFFQRDIINLFKVDADKKVLFSYSTYHFNNKKYTAHSNYQESYVIADIFNDMGYQVDVVNNNKLTKRNIEEYDVVFGEGLPIYQAVNRPNPPKMIYYGTGSHPFHCNQGSFFRLIDFYKKRGFLAVDSLRLSDNRWGVAASLCDAVICIGNDVTKKSFSDYGVSRIYNIDPSFHARQDALTIGEEKDFSQCRKSILWFGSYGLLHKGLDLAVDAVRERPDWHLYVCGYTDAESKLIEQLDLPSNVILCGFIDIFSPAFKDLCEKCGFVMLPSCSEGIATAVITCVANGAMLPIVTKECGFDIGSNGFIIDLTVGSIQSILDLLSDFDSNKLKEMALGIQRDTLARYTLDNYKINVKRGIMEVINGK